MQMGGRVRVGEGGWLGVTVGGGNVQSLNQPHSHHLKRVAFEFVCPLRCVVFLFCRDQTRKPDFRSTSRMLGMKRPRMLLRAKTTQTQRARRKRKRSNRSVVYFKEQ